MTDQELIAMLVRRDPDATGHLSQKYGAYCRTIAMNILSNEQDAEECCNDVYMQVWQHIPPLVPDNLKLYVAKVTRNLALHRLEHRSAQKRGAITLQLEELAQVIPDHLRSQQPEQIHLRHLLNQFIHSLPGEQRHIFLRRYWYGDTIEDIASRCKCSAGRIAGILYRTRQKLRKMLEKEDLNYE